MSPHVCNCQQKPNTPWLSGVLELMMYFTVAACNRTPQSENLETEVGNFLEEVLADLGCPQAEALVDTLSVLVSEFT